MDRYICRGDRKMSTYKTTISYMNGNGNTQYHTIHNIIANSIDGATKLALDDFHSIFGTYEIKKIVTELKQSTRWATGGILIRGDN